MLEPQTTILSHRLQIASQPIHYSLMWLILTILSRKRQENKTKTQSTATLSCRRKQTQQTACLIEIILLEIQCTIQLLQKKGKVCGSDTSNSDSRLTAEADTDHKPKNDADAQ